MRSMMRAGAAMLLALGLMTTTAFASGNEDPPPAGRVKSGPDKGAKVMLHIKPFNQDAEEYCVTCKAGPNPLVVAFVKHNDEATMHLLMQLGEVAEKGEEMHLNTAIVILGEGEDADGLKQCILDQKLAVPSALLGEDAAELKDWQLSARARNTVVFFHDGQVHHSAANVRADDLQKHVDDACQP